MSKEQHLSKAETARRYQVSWRWVHTLVTRYQSCGWEAVEPDPDARTATPGLSPLCSGSGSLRCGASCRPQAWTTARCRLRLQQEGLRSLAFSTIRRILTTAGLITPEPKKRPKSSYRRFQADQPNQCWQSDFTHWHLADGTGVEIINWLDDHSRYLLATRAYRRVIGQAVIGTFLAAPTVTACHNPP